MNARNQYLKVLQERYFMAKSRKEKSSILDEYCGNTGQNRKYVIRKINSSISLAAKRRGGKIGNLRWPCSGSFSKSLGHIRLSLWTKTCTPIKDKGGPIKTA